MSDTSTTHLGDSSHHTTALRLWPGITAAILLVLLQFALPALVPDAAPIGILGAVACGLAIVVWWAFFSRAPRLERWGGALLIAAAMAVTYPMLHVSIAQGAMGFLFIIGAIPFMALALVAWAVASRRLTDGPRRASMAAALLLASGAWLLLRTDGMKGSGLELRWRWTPTAEERLLAQGIDEPVPLPAAPPAATLPSATAAPAPAAAAPAPTSAPATPAEKPPVSGSAASSHPASNPAAAVAATTPPAASDPEIPRVEWPGFRGAARNSIVPGTRIATDWSASPPVVMWRRPIGPGWSSFAVSGGVLYTQEQRGEDEIVAAHSVATGAPVWRHRDPVRFWESNGGAGPRGTPTLHGGRVYTLGATGLLNALDAATGAVVWSRNVAAETKVPTPMWGFSGSPLVTGDVVIVAVSGILAGYDRATGAPRWTGPRHDGESYSSPHLATIDGVEQVVQMSAAGATGVAPEDGTILWEHAWEGGGSIVQPAVLSGDAMLISTATVTGPAGTRRLAVARTGGAWRADERWTSNGLKPHFNDFVLHEGHAYGYDGAILACIDLADGARKWKGGRYGQGQMLLLPDQDLLLVISEEGELALVGATPDQFRPIARVPGIGGKTWNHPVLVGDVLLVRNGEEMAAFRLPAAR